jgi:hypothetical protein
MLLSGSKWRERSAVQGVLHSAKSITKQRNQPYAPQWEQEEREISHSRSPTVCKMTMKLKNQHYARQWEQE